MPPYRFADPQARVYPETRDGHGELVGVAEPGDVRDFGVPPDHRWVPAEPGSSDSDAGRGGIESAPDPADVAEPGPGDGELPAGVPGE